MTEKVDLLASRLIHQADPPPTSVEIGNARNLRLDNDSVDVCVSSPPYCTRLDYVKASLGELAVLNVGVAATEPLREATIGSPVVRHLGGSLVTSGSDYVADLVGRIAGHDSKGSANYYAPWIAGYFDGMRESLAEVGRVLKPGGVAALVVQNSYYKDVCIDLPLAVEELSTAGGMRVKDRYSFEVPHLMTSINLRAKRHREVHPTSESLLILVKEI